MKRLVPVLCLLLAGSTVFAQARPVPAPPIIGATSYLIIDAKSGHELASLKPDTPVPPASLTKLMTTYVVFHAIEEGQITLEDEVTVSEKAWRMQGSRMFIEVGNRVASLDPFASDDDSLGDLDAELEAIFEGADAPALGAQRRSQLGHERPLVARLLED